MYLFELIVYVDLFNKFENVVINNSIICKRQFSDSICNNGCGNLGFKVYSRESFSIYFGGCI